jgi:spore coat polysaccharide biosynthesis protein SpsF
MSSRANSDSREGIRSRTVAILQARTSSSRLPGKVLLPLLGEPMLLRQIERVSRCSQIDDLVVATSVDPSDDAIEALCAANRVGCFRGSLEDVLDRFYRAAVLHRANTVVRLTGDCPLADPGLIDDVITFLDQGRFDFVSNAIEPTFPDGLDAAAFRMNLLKEAWQEATLPSDREHVTMFMRRHSARYRIGSYRGGIDRSHLRWTVDEPEDFTLVARIYEKLYPINPHFSTEDILRLLDAEPELLALNDGIERNEGLRRSLQKDPHGAGE